MTVKDLQNVEATTNSPVTILPTHRNPWTPRTVMKKIESYFVLRRQDQTSDRWCFCWLLHLHLPSPNDPGKTTVLTNPDLHCSQGTKEQMFQMFPRCVKTPWFRNNVSIFKILANCFSWSFFEEGVRRSFKAVWSPAEIDGRPCLLKEIGLSQVQF